jgi:hypothetical protein
VLSAGDFLAFGDGMTQWLPMYFGPHRPWEPNLNLGYPQFANPEQFWYPLAALRLIPHSFDAYVVSAYVVAACGAYGLVRSETRSSLGGVIGGLVYALGGFMMSHLQHLDIIHPAAWAPFVVWALRELRRKASLRWVAAGSVSFALCILGGQPQIALFTGVLALVLVLVAAFGVRPVRRRYVWSAVGSLACGIALAGIALVPGIELASRSIRAALPFYQFAEGVPVSHLPVRLFFPFLLGGTVLAPYRPASLDVGSFVEQSNYVGIITIVLAVLAVRSRLGSNAVRLWGAVALAALVLTTGNDLFAAELTYRLPLVDLFRSQGRHAFEFTLAIAVLAGYAIAALEAGEVSLRRILEACASVGVAMLLTLALAALSAAYALDRYVAQLADFRALTADPTRNAATAIPLGAFVVACAAIVGLQRWHDRVAAKLAIAVICGLDLASFAWFSYWHWAPLSTAALIPPPYVDRMRVELSRAHQREFFLPLASAVSAIRPNANLLWDVPSAWGSFALLPARTGALLHSNRSDFFGEALAADIENPADRSFDLASIRYFILPGRIEMQRSIERPFDESFDWGRRIGNAPWPASTSFALQRPEPATEVAVVSSLGLAASIPDGAPVADVVVTDATGRRTVLTMRAGRDTSEIAYDRFDVRVHVKHARAPVYSSRGPYHRYRTLLPLGRRVNVVRLVLLWRENPDRDASLLVDKISLVDRNGGRALPISPLFLLGDDPELRRVSWPGGDTILENARAFPRAWVVRHVLPTTPGAALAAIRGGTLDFRRTALVEGAARYDGTGSGGRIRFLRLDPGERRLDVDCGPERCFIVMSDAAYPGWSADVDGAPATLYTTDEALSGAFMPPGRHVLTLRFFSWTLAAGCAISIAAALVLVALPLLHRFQKRA